MALFGAMASSPFERIPLVRDAIGSFKDWGPLEPVARAVESVMSLGEGVLERDFGVSNVKLATLT